MTCGRKGCGRGQLTAAPARRLGRDYLLDTNDPGCEATALDELFRAPSAFLTRSPILARANQPLLALPSVSVIVVLPFGAFLISWLQCTTMLRCDRRESAQAVSKLEGVATASKNLCKLTRSRESFRTYSHQVTNEATVRAVVKNRPAF